MLLLMTFAPWLLFAFLGQEASAAGDRRQRTGVRTRTFSIQGTRQCTWGADDVGGAVTLSVSCENAHARTSGPTCEYVGEPRRCPGYVSDRRGFWKQVGRALKRLQGKVCADERALVKAGMCRRAPRAAHFRLAATVGTVTRAAPTACAGRAEEYCGESWASVCAFLFAMLQNQC